MNNLLKRLHDLPNPWGFAGNFMNPGVRIVVILLTSICGGFLIGWLFTVLPLWAAMILGVVLGIWVLTFVAQTFLFMQEMKNFLRESQARFDGLVGQMKRSVEEKS